MNVFDSLRRFRILSLRFGSYHFNPGLISTLLTVALLYTMISLGFWQLGRAEFKDTLQQNIEERKKLSHVGLDELPLDAQDRRFYPVRLTGRYDNEHSFLLDNKIREHRVGYHVFTPMQLIDGNSILVDRGYIGQGKSREEIPDIAVTDDQVTITGLLDYEPPRGLQLTEIEHSMDQWPVVLQHVDIAEISQVLDYQLYDMVLWLDEDKIGSLTYDLPALNLNSAKNNGYAFQWFAMSTALLIIYIVVNTRAQKQKKTTNT